MIPVSSTAPRPGVPADAPVERLLTDAVVRVLRSVTGRGATQAQGIIKGDIAVVVVRDFLTPGEKNLVARGHGDEVARLRYAYQRAMEEDVVPAVRDAVGREVLSFMSCNDNDPDCSAEVFLLGDPV